MDGSDSFAAGSLLVPSASGVISDRASATMSPTAAHFNGQEIWRSLHVDHERRPGKVLGAVSLAGERMVVFTESRSFDQLPYASVQRIGLSIEALFMQASIQQPIEYRPCRSAPQRQGLIGIIGRIIDRHARYRVGASELVGIVEVPLQHLASNRFGNFG